MPKVDFTKTRKAAYKEANVRSIKKNEEIICNIVPTAFAVNKEHVQKDIIVDYLNRTTITFDRIKREKSFIQTSYHWNYCLINISAQALCIVGSILDNLKANSNLVDISNNKYAVSNSRNYYRGVVELEKHNLIRLTNKKHIIVINHNDIFLGNFNRFCELYNDIYGDMEVAVDGRGRIIL